MNEKILMAGSGGQGVLTLGVFIAKIGVFEGKKVTWLPSYGAEKRGGFSFCFVVISDDEIYSPVVEKADTLILFDQRAMDIFGDKTNKNTLTVINSSLIKKDNIKQGTKIAMPATDMAQAFKFIRGMNIIMAGAYLEAKRNFKKESAVTVMKQLLGKRDEEIVEKNLRAFDEGIKFAAEYGKGK